jgi:DNA polymerase-3 subunit gamma/tau
MVTTPSPDLSVPAEIITITEEEIVATLPVTEPKEESGEGETPDVSTSVTEEPTVENEPTPPMQKEEPPVESKPVAKPVVTEPSAPAVNPHQKTFDTLVKKLYDRDYDLGACFERNITFENFADNKLTWGSMAEGEDKKMLITHWGLINMFVKDLFGFETKIVNMPKKKIDTPEVTQKAKEENLPQNTPVHEDADSASMIEDIEMKSSCIAPEAGETEAAKKKDPSTLLEEPMIKEAIALFDPKKVRIKRNT